MPSFCAVRNCELKYNKTENVSFHKFPQHNNELRKKWIEFTGRENWEPSRWSALCSRHFRPEDFKTKNLAKNSSRMSLKINAYPIIASKNSKETNDSTKIDISSDNNPSNSEILKSNLVEISQPQEVKVQNNNIKIESVIPVATSNYQKNFMTQTRDFLPASVFTTIHSCPNNSTDDLFRSSIDLNVEQSSTCLTLNQLNNSADISNTSNDNPADQINLVIQEKPNLTNQENQNCRLCSNAIDSSDSAVSFSTDFEIFGMLQKCFPTINMQQEDNHPKNICSFCLEKLDDFSDFIDLVIESQKRFDQRFQKLPTRNERIKIKQEPTLRIKQEVSENITIIQNDINVGENKYENREEGNDPMILNHHSDSTDFDEIERKSQFYDLPILDAKDMDIMEIISLDDAFIDIDEMTDDAGNLSDSDLLNITNSLKSIDNDEIKNNEIKNFADNFISSNDAIHITDKVNNSDVNENSNSKCPEPVSNNHLKNEFRQSVKNNDSEGGILENTFTENIQIHSANHISENLKIVSKPCLNLVDKPTIESELNDKKENLSVMGNKEEDIKHFNETDNQSFYDPLHEHNYTKYYKEHNYKTEEPEHETEDLVEIFPDEEVFCSQSVVDLSNEDIKPPTIDLESTDSNQINNEINSVLEIESELNVRSKLTMEQNNHNYESLSDSCINVPIENSSIHAINIAHDLTRSISSLKSTNLSTKKNLISSVINIEQNLFLNAINKSVNINPKQSIVVLNESILKPSFNLLNSKSDCPLQNNGNENLMPQTEYTQPLYKPSEICTYLCQFCNSNFNSFFDLLNHRNSCEFRNSAENSDCLNICCDDYEIHQTKKIKIEEGNSIKIPIQKNEANCDQEITIMKTESTNLLIQKNVQDVIADSNIENILENKKIKYQSMYKKNKNTIDNAMKTKNLSQVNNGKKNERHKINSFPLIKPIGIYCKMCDKKFETKVALNNHKKYLCAYKHKSDGFFCKYCNHNLRKWIECRQHEKKCKLNFRKKNRRNLRIHKSKGIPLNEPPKILENIQMLRPKVDLIVSDLNFKEFNKEQEKITTINGQNKMFNGILVFPNNTSQQNNEILVNNNFSNDLNSAAKQIKLNYGINNQLLCIPIDHKYFTENLTSESLFKQNPLETVLDKNLNNSVHFKCINCSKFFITEEFLVEHQVDCLKGIMDETVQPKKPQTQFNCEKCKKQFKALKNLIQHRITHTSIRNYQCHLCKDKFFKRSNGLNQHIKSVHEGLKPYNCLICNHCYALKGDALRCRHSSLKLLNENN